jgi:hypothetical protein
MEDQRYIEIPGDETHELPPLLLHAMEEHAPGESAVDIALVMSEAEDMLTARDEEQEMVEQRKFELALQLAEQYKSLVTHWFWGDGILEWIRQCETTFENQRTLRQLLHPDVWPHASRASFVTLLADKGVDSSHELVRAVGLRLTFRQPPPIDCFSNQFLFYLNSKVADTAYQTWSHLAPSGMAFPPERFHFEVLSVGN